MTCINRLLVAILLASCMTSCLLMQPRKEVAKILDELEQRGPLVKETARNAADGAVEGLLQDSVRIRALVRSLMQEASKETLKMSSSLRDSLLSEETAEWVSGRLSSLSDSTRQAIIRIVNDDPLRNGTRRIVASLRDELLGYATLEKIGTLRDSLMGARTRRLVDGLISTSVQQFASDYERSLQPLVYELIDKINKTGSDKIGEVRTTLQSLIWLLAVLFLCIIGVSIFIYRIQQQKKQVEKTSKEHELTLEAITRTIDSLPEDFYKQVALKVKASAIQMGINSHLNMMLDKFDLPEREKGKKKDAVTQLSSKMISSPELERIIRKELGDEEMDRLFKKST